METQELKNFLVDKRGSEIVQRILHKKIKSWMDVLELSNEGVTKETLMGLVRYLDFSTNKIAMMLPVTVRTIQRYPNKKRFAPFLSEHIIQLVLIAGRGTRVFGSREKFLDWFNMPSHALGGKSPGDMVKLKIGAGMVMDEIGRIEHGVYS